jgi:cytochrome c biogenesis protein CcdA
MNAVLVINLVTSIVVFVTGVLILAGIVPAGNSYIRVIFGIIFMLYGVYRFLNFRTKKKLQQIEENREKMQRAKDKLFEKKNEK